MGSDVCLDCERGNCENCPYLDLIIRDIKSGGVNDRKQ